MPGRRFNNRLNNYQLRLIIRATFRAAKNFKQGLIATYKAHSQRLVRIHKFRRSILNFNDSLTVRTTRRTYSTGRAKTTFTVQKVNSRRVLSTRVIVLTVRHNRLLAFINTARRSQSFSLVRVMNVRQLSRIRRRMINSVRYRKSKARTYTNRTTARPVQHVTNQVRTLSHTDMVTVTSGRAIGQVVIISSRFSINLNTFQRTLDSQHLLIRNSDQVNMNHANKVVMFTERTAM